MRRDRIGILTADENSLTAAQAVEAYPHIDFKTEIEKMLGDGLPLYDCENFSLHIVKGGDSAPNVVNLFVPRRSGHPIGAQVETIHIGNTEECFDLEEDREAWRHGQSEGGEMHEH